MLTKHHSQQIRNDVSSTKIRTFLRKDMSIRFLVPDPVSSSGAAVKNHTLTLSQKVIKYIEKNQLYINGEGTEQA
jgi:nicotinic acid mononucleotide adenylyltransferase